jgi:peptide/nickel transport system substrate-binding protein
MRRLTRTCAVLTVGLLAGTLAACGSSASSSGAPSSASGGTVLTIDNENGALWTCDFSPFNPSDNFLSVGFVYEPLVYVNPLQNAKTTPMLATSWQWGAGNKSLTFTIRQGVKWNNGTPMTAADVVYTFDLIKKYPALDLTGVWSVLSSVKQVGSDQVTFNFSSVAVP